MRRWHDASLDVTYTSYMRDPRKPPPRHRRQHRRHQWRPAYHWWGILALTFTLLFVVALLGVAPAAE